LKYVRDCGSWTKRKTQEVNEAVGRGNIGGGSRRGVFGQGHG